MKMNKFMRIASVLMILTLISTCAISGTFAKYTTSATAADTARVAKWGVVIKTWDTDSKTSAFTNNYDDTVVSTVVTDQLVAPGTKNETGIKFSITGQAETDLKLNFDFNVTDDVIVPAGTYLDWTTGNSTTDQFTLDEDYTPVVFTLAGKDGNGTEWTVSGTLAEIKTAFEALATEKTIEANVNLSEMYGEYTLTWAWDFDDNGAGTNDKADTLLGNKAAGIASDAAVITNIAFDISISATQID